MTTQAPEPTPDSAPALRLNSLILAEIDGLTPDQVFDKYPFVWLEMVAKRDRQLYPVTPAEAERVATFLMGALEATGAILAVVGVGYSATVGAHSYHSDGDVEKRQSAAIQMIEIMAKRMLPWFKVKLIPRKM